MTATTSALPLLNQILDSLAVGEVHLTASTLHGETGVQFPDDFPATCVHHVRQGPVWLDGPGIEPQRLDTGDIAWVLRAGGHRGRTAPEAPVVPLSQTRIELGLGVAKQLECGTGASRVRIFSSHLLWARSQPHPLFDLLPRVFVVPAAELGEGVAALLGLLTSERESGAAGSAVVATRLTELLWIHLVRRAAEVPLADPGLLPGLAHEGLARAMSAVAKAPADPWTLEGLGRTAGMSRTQFARTFRARVGLTPFDYVRRWRVHRAQELLRDDRQGLEAVAAEVGYASSVSFSRSFAAVTGLPPGQWRRRHLGAVSDLSG
ncbi:MAG: AraC family transcriptional regulator [Myxococcota bacterium]